MQLQVGDRVEVEAEGTQRRPRQGAVQEVLGSPVAPRYRIQWDDGHESIYLSQAGALHKLRSRRRRKAS
ncbi:MAG: DUF1918 domain-containing protein [Thermoleophilaceae bacterium]|jgi:hypothetical protein